MGMSLKQTPESPSLITNKEVAAFAHNAGQLEHNQTMVDLQDRRDQRKVKDRKANRRVLARGSALAAAGVLAVAAAAHRQEGGSTAPSQSGNAQVVEVVNGRLASIGVSSKDATPAMRHVAETLANEGHVPSSP